MTAKGDRKGIHRLSGRLKQVIDPAVAKALSHPLRSHILVTLGARIASPNEMARELGLEPRDLNYHIKVLVEIDMIRLVRTEKRRGVKEHFYELTRPTVYIDDRQWRCIPLEIRSRLSANLLQIMVDDAVEALEAGTFSARDSHQSHTSLLLNERGWSEVTNVMGAALEQVLEIGDKCAKDLEKDGGEGIPIHILMMGFETASGKRVKAVSAKRSA